MASLESRAGSGKVLLRPLLRPLGRMGVLLTFWYWEMGVGGFTFAYGGCVS